MKKLILSELILIFLATTFVTDSPPPGWYQQTLPRSDITIQDLYFLDSLNGYVAARKTILDSSFIYKTTDGGNNWIVSFGDSANLTTIQFLDSNNGYALGRRNAPFRTVYKTINGGSSWIGINIPGVNPTDLFFINKDTGWVSDNVSVLGAGLIKTVNGGMNWTQQLDGSYRPSRLFFLNNDTGWAVCNTTRLYRTTNSGMNWGQIYNFTGTLVDVFFISKDTGWVTGGGGGTGIMKTIDGGTIWFSANNPTPYGNSKLYFISSRVGWAGSGLSKIVATKDGINWGYQTTPNYTHYSVQFVDSLRGWAGGGGNDIIHTIDGGGPNAIQQITNKTPLDFRLYQNYPNPFNPNTKIKYDLRKPESEVRLVIYDITGKEITTLVNKKQGTGTYEVDFSGEGLSSGVYFYKIIITSASGGGREVFSETRRMLLIK